MSKSADEKQLRSQTNQPRCPWVNLKNPLYVEYHDNEWGVPVTCDRHHFEMITLEGAQAGLSWETILNKREGYRRAFVDFDVEQVARFTKRKIKSLLQNPEIVRNRLKVESTINNARAFLKIQAKFGTFNQYVWDFIDHEIIVSSFHDLQDYPTKTPQSDALSKDLKKRGFRFVGSTTIYAYMQAAGLVDDHTSDCFVRVAASKSTAKP